MRKKLAASLFLFAAVYMNQHNPLVKSVLKKDFFFAVTATAYENHFGALLPSIERSGIKQTSHVSTSNQLIAEKNGLVTRIQDKTITIQQEDGTEMEVIGLQTSAFRLFEKIRQGELIGTPSGEIIEFIERKNGQVISSRKWDAHEAD